MVNNLNSYEGINLIQSLRSKLQLPDLVCTFCQNSLLRKQLYTDVFWPGIGQWSWQSSSTANLPVWDPDCQIWLVGRNSALRGSWTPLLKQWRSYPVSQLIKGVLGRVCLITFARGKVTSIYILMTGQNTSVYNCFLSPPNARAKRQTVDYLIVFQQFPAAK